MDSEVNETWRDLNGGLLTPEQRNYIANLLWIQANKIQEIETLLAELRDL